MTPRGFKIKLLSEVFGAGVLWGAKACRSPTTIFQVPSGPDKIILFSELIFPKVTIGSEIVTVHKLFWGN